MADSELGMSPGTEDDELSEVERLRAEVEHLRGQITAAEKSAPSQGGAVEGCRSRAQSLRR